MIKGILKMVLIRSLLILCIVLFSSCMRDSDDCICTQEFRTVTVFVIDENNKPVDSLVTTITDEEGKKYDVSDPPFFPGYYPVMHDGYVNDFSVVPKKILFEGIKDSLSASGEFLINTDECSCHINKVSGPDTLIVQ